MLFGYIIHLPYWGLKGGKETKTRNKNMLAYLAYVMLSCVCGSKLEVTCFYTEKLFFEDKSQNQMVFYSKVSATWTWVEKKGEHERKTC
jgi:hypothetical protein